MARCHCHKLYCAASEWVGLLFPMLPSWLPGRRNKPGNKPGCEAQALGPGEGGGRLYGIKGQGRRDEGRRIAASAHAREAPVSERSQRRADAIGATLPGFGGGGSVPAARGCSCHRARVSRGVERQQETTFKRRDGQERRQSAHSSRHPRDWMTRAACAKRLSARVTHVSRIQVPASHSQHNAINKC